MSLNHSSTFAVAQVPLQRSGRLREVLVGHDAFTWLKSIQQAAPAPRLELRYFTEGAVLLLSSTSELREAWQTNAKAALLEHLQADLERKGKPQFRTTLPLGQGEGAEARIQEQATQPIAPEPKCKAVHIGEAVFDELRRLQDSSRDPRAGLRYWMEGAMSLLQQRGDLHNAWVVHARAAMQSHLSKLQQLDPTPPTS